MNKVNEIVFSKDRYGGSREKMFEAVTKQLMILMDNEYVCKVYDDDIDVIIIQYEHDNHRDNWGTPYLCWLRQEQLETLEDLEMAESLNELDEEPIVVHYEGSLGEDTTFTWSAESEPPKTE